MIERYQWVILGLGTLAAIWLDVRLIRCLRNHQDRIKPVKIRGWNSYLLGAVFYSIRYINPQNVLPKVKNILGFLLGFHPIQWIKRITLVSPATRTLIITKILPVVLMIGWGSWMGRGYLNFDPNAIINGGDFPHQIYNHYAWQTLTKCGTCVFWNGVMDGGQPTFAEVQGAALHPLVIVTTLIWGAVNGAKVIMIVSLITVGLAQYWLARVMKLSTPAASWAGIMAITGGHLADRMGGGWVNMILTMAWASLVLPPLIDLLHNRNKRASVWIGVFLALSLLSGQGYIQVAIIFGLGPAVLIYWLFQRKNLPEMGFELLFVAGLTVLLTAVLWVPLLRLLPYVSKDGDPYLASLLALDITPLKLLLRDEKSLFIGWIPVLLAFSTLHFVPKDQKPLMWFLWLAAALIFLVSSADFLRFVHNYFEQVGVLRFAFHMNLLAVPFIIALAAWGLDYLLKIPISLSFIHQAAGSFNLRIVWILFPLVVLLSIPPVYKFSRWRYDTHKVERPEMVMQWFKTDSTEIIRVPMPDYDWTPLVIERGYKSTGVFRSWWWKNRQQPTPYLEATTEQVDAFEMQYENLYLIRRENARYAAVRTNDGGYFPCQAQAVGGHIDITCTNDRPGRLVVMENNFPGWMTWIDGQRSPLINGDWLSTDAPAGHHTYAFRYRPWDVWVGMALSLLGVVTALLAWRKVQNAP
jgi:hypothetical protein